MSSSVSFLQSLFLSCKPHKAKQAPQKHHSSFHSPPFHTTRMILILSLHQPPPSSRHNRQSPSSDLHHRHPTTTIRFRTEYQESLQYLKRLGLVSTNPRFPISPSRATIDRVLVLIHFLKASGIPENDLPKLASSCPQLFASGLHPSDISPVFDFLISELGASPESSAAFILRCPNLLFSSVEHRLRPTLTYLQSIGVERLDVPNHLNAHLLNIRVERLVEKIEWLVGIGFKRSEAEAACGRMRALFGYSIVNCMKPKYEYLVGEMRRDVEEVKEFPQYFGFSLPNRIMPRHLHLKQRGVTVSLRYLLVCGDDKFYHKWK